MATTIFSEMSALALEHDAINLGQGFPDTPGPREVIDAAVAAMHRGANQYPPAIGIASLREAIAEHQRRFYGLDVDPDTGVVVCSGASEALSSAMTALLSAGGASGATGEGPGRASGATGEGPGRASGATGEGPGRASGATGEGPGRAGGRTGEGPLEVIALEPYYDLYAATAALVGARLVPVRLHAPDYRLDAEALRAAVTERTRMIVLNTPHNPTGAVLSRAELESVAAVARDHDLVVLADEVYEHLVFDDEVHVPVATLPGMAERTITVGSGGKTFSVTGWKIGWATGPAALIAKVLGVKQWFSFAAGTPLQHGIAAGLTLPDERLTHLGDDLAAKRDLLTAGLREIGMEVHHSKATYFVTADIAPLGETDSLAFCRALPERVGVAAVPNQVFHASPVGVETQVRFACCKRDDVLADALLRLRKL